MERINKLIRELLSTPPKKESCNCGCHSCENVGNAGPVLNESLGAKITMTENMQHHVKNKLPITENTFRYGSESFLDLWAEARYLYSRNAIHVNDDDKHIILETNLGEYGMYDGKKVPLDMIMEEDEIPDERGTKDDIKNAVKFLPLSNLLDIIKEKYIHTDNKTYNNLYEELQRLFTLDPKNKISYTEVLIVLKKHLTDAEVNELPASANAGVNEIKVNKPNPLNYLLDLRSKIDTSRNIEERLSLAIQCAEKVLFIFEEKYPDDKRPRKALDAAKAYLANPTKENQNAAKDTGDAAYNAGVDVDVDGNDDEDEDDYTAESGAAYAALSAAYATFNTDSAFSAAIDAITAVEKYYNLNESKDKKSPPLNKPKRGGSKKFYVYVRNPKTKKIKKVSFGDTTGLSAKLNNPKARKAFAARHDCKNKKDKTKASYWSCHLPRYAKLLGIKSNFSGYW